MRKALLMLALVMGMSCVTLADGSDPMPLCRHGVGPGGKVCPPSAKK